MEKTWLASNVAPIWNGTSWLTEPAGIVTLVGMVMAGGRLVEVSFNNLRCRGGRQTRDRERGGARDHWLEQFHENPPLN